MKRRQETHPDPSRHHFTWLRPSQTSYRYSHRSTAAAAVWASLETTCLSHGPIPIDFCPRFHYSPVKCHMKHKFLCLQLMYSIAHTEDLTIPLLLLPYRMCFDKIGDHSSQQWWQGRVIPDWWIRHFAPQSWLQQKMHSRSLPCSHVWTLSSLLVWQSRINTQSKRGFFCLRLIFCFSVAKAQKTKRRTIHAVEHERRRESGSSRRRYSVTVYSAASLKHSGTR